MCASMADPFIQVIHAIDKERKLSFDCWKPAHAPHPGCPYNRVSDVKRQEVPVFTLALPSVQLLTYSGWTSLSLSWYGSMQDRERPTTECKCFWSPWIGLLGHKTELVKRSTGFMMPVTTGQQSLIFLPLVLHPMYCHSLGTWHLQLHTITTAHLIQWRDRTEDYSTSTLWGLTAQTQTHTYTHIHADTHIPHVTVEGWTDLRTEVRVYKCIYGEANNSSACKCRGQPWVLELKNKSEWETQWERMRLAEMSERLVRQCSVACECWFKEKH